LPIVRIAVNKIEQAKTLVNCVRNDFIHKKSNSQVIDERVYLGEVPAPYQENLEMAHVNMAKIRLETGEPFEWPNIVALNWAVTSLIGKAKRIVEIGAGTGAFAAYASVDPSRIIFCLEGDDFAREKAIDLRCRPNTYYYKSIQECPEKQFELLVSIEVIEHVDDVSSFLKFCLQLAPRAIISTPNRNVVRGNTDLGPPVYKPHVREFDPGELYWVLRQYYGVVRLFHMPNAFVPWLAPMTIATQGTPIIAECSDPYV
jgi:2-polyprenyl-3-methyl-5-hydroxy-6-metoxy-1,4-benzoquinol methylase